MNHMQLPSFRSFMGDEAAKRLVSNATRIAYTRSNSGLALTAAQQAFMDAFNDVNQFLVHVEMRLRLHESTRPHSAADAEAFAGFIRTADLALAQKVRGTVAKARAVLNEETA